MSLTLVVLAGTASVLLVAYIASTWKFNYWKKRNVPYLTPLPLLGNYGDYILMKKDIGSVVNKICDAFPKAPYIGAFFGTEPTIIVKDPELIKLVTTKDFIFFNGREVSKYSDREINSRNVFSESGTKWKVTRQKITPLFTSAKLKNMFPLIQKCAFTFEDFCDREFSMSEVVEARMLIARYTMDCVCSIVFGIDANVMGSEGKNTNPFRVMGDLIFNNSWKTASRMIGKTIWPAIFYGLGFQLIPHEVIEFFQKFLLNSFKERELKPSQRQDFVDLIIKVKKGDVKSEDIAIDDDFLVAQCVVFFAAGYETSASTLSYLLYELAKHQEAQTRVIEEIDEYLARTGNKFTFDCVNDLPYSEACLNETMRKYPVLSVITREVMQDYTMPDGVVLNTGVRVHLPIKHMHYNPDYFPEPKKFIPERFLPENKANIKPYTFMPFGEGPRICMGMRTAIMQMMPGLIAVMKKYRVELAEGMPSEVELDPKTFVAQPIGGLNLRLVRREGWQQRVFARD